MPSDKPIRLLTSRSPSGVEWLEIDSHGTIWWKADEADAGAGFPVDEAFVRDKFAECGRTFDPSRLPEHTIRDPYAHWR